MGQLKRSIIANMAGKSWSAFMGLAFIPLYIKFMGIEAYGLIGLFATMQALANLLDMGLSSTLNREMARYSARPDQAAVARDLVRTLEVIYWGIGGVIGLGVLALSGFIAHSWINSEQLSPGVVQQTIVTMGLVMAAQWPLSFYQGGLMGLQRQELMNVITAGSATVRSVGAVLILALISPTIQAFFTWQVVTSTVQTSLTALTMWRCLPKASRKPQFRRDLLSGVWRFAAGLSAISVVTVFLTQLDKVILSRVLTLEMFGYYSFASSVASSLNYLITPVYEAVFPGLSRLVALRDVETLRSLYHKSSQVMSVILLPAAVLLALFSPEILIVWTRNPATVANSYLTVSLLVVGTALNGLLHLPYALQLAHGWTKLAFYTNVISAIILAPLTYFLAVRYGATGAAMTWIALNAGSILVSIQIMHRRLLSGDQWEWYYEDVGKPLMIVVLIMGLARFMVSGDMPVIALAAFLIVVYILTLTVTIWTVPVTRTWLRRKLSIGSVEA